MTTAAPPPSQRRRALVWGGAGVAALVLAVVLGEAAGWPFLRGPLQSALQRATGVPVAMDGKFRVRLLWQPHLDLGHLRVGAASGVAVPHLLDGQDVELAWRWHDVWRWQRGDEVLQLRRLHAGVLDAHLVRTKDGRASWQLGRADRPPPAAGEAGSGLPRIASLAVRQGHIAVDDAVLQTRLRVELQGQEGNAAAAPGYTATVTGTYRALPLKLHARAGAALPLLQEEGAEDQAAAVPVRVEGEAGASRLLFDGSAAALLGDWRMDGQLRFRGPSMARVGEPLGLTLPHTAPFEIVGHLSQGAGVWHLRVDRASVGRSRLAGDFRYDTRVSPALLSGRLSGPLLALADLGPAVGAALPGQAAPQATPARVLPQRDFDLPSLRAMDADLQVAIDEFDLGTPALAPLRQLRTQVQLAKGVLRLQDLKAQVAGGQVSGSTLLDGTADTALWVADLKFRAIDVAGWIRGLQAPAGAASAAPSTRAGPSLRAERKQARQGGDQVVKSYLTGALTADVKVSGRGRSTADILGSLQGRADLTLQDGTLSHLVTELLGLDIAQALGVLIRGDRPLPLRCARVDLVLKQGVAVPRLAVFDNQDSLVRIDGRIDLRDESLALRVVARPKDFSPLSLRSPLLVTGTLAHPVVGIEGRKLAARGLVAAALAIVAAPVAVLLPFVDTGTRETGDPCETPSATPVQAASAASAARK